MHGQEIRRLEGWREHVQAITRYIPARPIGGVSKSPSCLGHVVMSHKELNHKRNMMSKGFSKGIKSAREITKQPLAHSSNSFLSLRSGVQHIALTRPLVLNT